MNLSDFKHKTQVRVRSYEVDPRGIVHNAVYFQYLETGRVEYRKSYGYKINHKGIFNDNLKIVVVHNSIDYKDFAYIDDLLNIYTRIAWIKDSSFSFEQIIENDKTKSIICEGKGILVNLNHETNEPEKINDSIIDEIKNFEKKLEIKPN